MTFDSSILPLLILLPFIGGVLAWLTERVSVGLPRWIALLTMTTVLVISVMLWFQGEYGLSSLTGQEQWKLLFSVPWIPSFGISFTLGLDGLSVLMLLLTGLLGVMAVVCSWKEIDKHVGFFHLNLLWNLGGVIGVFLALDMFLFFFFWEMMLVPMYFLIALWGHQGSNGQSRITAANKFFIYTQASGLIMLVAIGALVLINAQATGVITFNYFDLLRTHTFMAPVVEMVLMLGFFIAFAVKMPVVPVHSWLPDAHSQAPTAGSVDLAGVLLKTAAYGLLRFGVPLFPNASFDFAPIAMWLGVFGIIYGAVLACAQTDIKRLIAYTSISHMGFVLIGIYSGNAVALQGVVIQMLAHGLSAGALFILCGELYERLHTRDLRQMGGLWTRLKYLPPLTLFFAAASLGLPGMGNFVGEILILLGAFKANQVVTIVSATGLILAAVYGLLMMQRAFYGTGKTEEPLPDLNARELGLMLSLVVLLLLLGLYPQPVLDTTAVFVDGFQNMYLQANAPVASSPAVINVTP